MRTHPTQLEPCLDLEAVRLASACCVGSRITRDLYLTVSGYGSWP